MVKGGGAGKKWITSPSRQEARPLLQLVEQFVTNAPPVKPH